MDIKTLLILSEAFFDMQTKRKHLNEMAYIPPFLFPREVFRNIRR